MNLTLNPSRPGRSRLSGVWTFLGGGSRAVRIIMLHGVGGPDMPAAAFERQMRYFKQTFDVVSIDHALNTLASNTTAKRPQLVLTFDDGLRNHAELVYPLLASLGLPAVFYVCPGLIDQGAWQWPHEVRQRLLSLPPGELPAALQRLGAGVTAIESAMAWMKDLPAPQARDALTSVRESTPHFVPNENQRRRFDVMSWSQLMSLDPAVITVGSHTVSHPIMTGLDPTELETEVRESRSWLESRLQRRIDHFCYPNGSTNKAVRDTVARHHRCAVTTETGYTHAGADPMTLPRIAAHPSHPRMVVNLHRPYPA